MHGSRRFLFATSFQPSEFGKLAVVVWVSMLVLKKGEQLRRLTKGVLPILLVIGVLHGLNIVLMPVLGRLFSLNRSLSGEPRRDRSSEPVDLDR